MVTRRLMAIDPSLTCSGWALFSVTTGSLMAVGKIHSIPASHPMGYRLKALQSRIQEMQDKLSLTSNDVLICEAQTTMRDPRSAFKVEQVRGIFEAIARTKGVSVPGRINPRSVHHEIMGLKGKQAPRDQVKETAVRLVRALFADSLQGMGFDICPTALSQHQDIVDAILVGNLGVTWLKAATSAGVEFDEYFESRIRSRRRPSVAAIRRAC